MQLMCHDDVGLFLEDAKLHYVMITKEFLNIVQFYHT